MARIIDGVKAAWKRFLAKAAGALSAGANILLLIMIARSGGNKELAQKMLDEAEQRIIAGDSVMVITAVRDSTGTTISRDTLVRPVVDADLNTGMFRLRDTTANGHTMYTVTLASTDMITEKDSVHYIIASIPPIGTQWNVKIRQGKTEIAKEKIAGELDELVARTGNDSLCNVIGWYSVKDTVETDDKGATELARRWTKDKAAKPERVKYVAPEGGEVGR